MVGARGMLCSKLNYKDMMYSMNKKQIEAVNGILEYLRECGNCNGKPEWPKVCLKDMYEGIFILNKFYDDNVVMRLPPSPCACKPDPKVPIVVDKKEQQWKT